ncbi:MAG: hypothetical protein DLM67_26410 [Candidatus Nephthysia bennettiae]|nr:MAG: hypothetical protein DLM67_26410 [Candidatus Dormibacteraeota bacterium]
MVSSIAQRATTTWRMNTRMSQNVHRQARTTPTPGSTRKAERASRNVAPTPRCSLGGSLSVPTRISGATATMMTRATQAATPNASTRPCVLLILTSAP